MDTPFADQPEVRRFYWRWEKALLACMPEQSPRVLGALSGGCDSIVLARMLRAAQQRGLCALTLGHVHHGLRPEADREEAFVRSTAAAWGIGLRVERVDALAEAEATGQSVEQAARALRRQALGRMARAANCRYVALGHHMDDQAETVLLRILRGTGPRGLGAMGAREPLAVVDSDAWIIRPLLGFRREELHAVAARADLTWVEDASNRDPGHLRNRIRHELLPHLASAFNPRIVERLADLAHWQRAADAVVRVLAEDVAQRARTGHDANRLDVHILAAQPEAVTTRVLWQAYQQLAGDDATLSSEHIRQLLRLLRAPAEESPGEVLLPAGVQVARAGGTLRFERRAARTDGSPAPDRYAGENQETLDAPEATP